MTGNGWRKEKGLQYVGLDGFVGIIANGAGLAMSTCDVVNQVGGAPANFLDIGGGASAEVMANALEVINTDPNVRSIFINIFGGIARGEEVANGHRHGARARRHKGRRWSSASTAQTPTRRGRYWRTQLLTGRSRSRT